MQSKYMCTGILFRPQSNAPAFASILEGELSDTNDEKSAYID